MSWTNNIELNKVLHPEIKKGLLYIIVMKNIKGRHHPQQKEMVTFNQKNQINLFTNLFFFFYFPFRTYLVIWHKDFYLNWSERPHNTSTVRTYLFSFSTIHKFEPNFNSTNRSSSGTTVSRRIDDGYPSWHYKSFTLDTYRT